MSERLEKKRPRKSETKKKGDESFRPPFDPGIIRPIYFPFFLAGFFLAAAFLVAHFIVLFSLFIQFSIATKIKLHRLMILI
jgi:hypothetical protein